MRWIVASLFVFALVAGCGQPAAPAVHLNLAAHTQAAQLKTDTYTTYSCGQDRPIHRFVVNVTNDRSSPLSIEEDHWAFAWLPNDEAPPVEKTGNDAVPPHASTQVALYSCPPSGLADPQYLALYADEGWSYYPLARLTF